jgi:outer membrane protein insertion porin family
MKKIIIVLTLLISSIASASKIVERVEVSCDKDDCSAIENRFIDFVGLEAHENTIRERMRFKLFDRSLSKLSYEFHVIDGEGVLKIDAALKPTLGRIQLRVDDGVALPGIESHFGVREGDYIDSIRISRVKEGVLRFLTDRGYLTPNVVVIPRARTNDDRIDLDVTVTLSELVRIRDIHIVTTNPQQLGRVRSRYAGLRGQILDRLRFRLITDQLSRDLFESGFYESSVTILDDELIEGSSDVILRVQVHYGSLYSFNFRGNHHLDRNELISNINDSIKKVGGIGQEHDIIETVQKAYKNIGLYNNSISVRVARGRNKFDLEYVNFFINITEGEKIPVTKVEFVGNTRPSRELRRLYRQNASSLASAGFLDEAFLKDFTTLLFRHYLSKGFVQVDIPEPEVTFDDRGRAIISYRIRERSQVILTSINFEFEDEALRGEALALMKNKIGAPLDIVNLDTDINAINRLVQSRGYYFAEVDNADDEKFIVYNRGLTEAELNIGFESFKKTKLNSVIITGYDRTRYEVLRREVHLESGDFVTPQDIVRIRDLLSSLDLFSFVRVTPFVIEEDIDEYFNINLLIQVEEKEFGVAEIAPGYRTDLGLKFSTGITYNNLYGMNRSATLQAEANRRFSYGDFDARRRAEKNQLIEYLVRASFTEPYLFPDFFKTRLQFDMAAAIQRKRFVSFDADIFRLSPQVSKSFFQEKLTLSLKYQFETINQFDATNTELNDNFTIGSLTPSVTLDFRDDPLRPTRGTLFNMSWEFANPYFLSMDNDDLTVNYYRLVSRNYFYTSLTPSVVLAFSASGGVQKNFAKDVRRDELGNPIVREDGRAVLAGYIPSTKVFRLDGVDVVRGFSAEEINRLTSGVNVGEVVVDDTAYFLNFKIEPRYYMTDAFAVGAFLDAGRLYLRKVALSDMRWSTGASFKVLTPVGSLDFDYGLKLNRNRFDDGGRERFGRFHLSIGFF